MTVVLGGAVLAAVAAVLGTIVLGMGIRATVEIMRVRAGDRGM